MTAGDGGRVSVARVPTHLLTGFLGAGKTTLLNALLRHEGLRSTAVLVNEFGAVGIDHLLVERVEHDMLLLATGCICCMARGDLTEGLERLLEARRARRVRFDRIVIETTGLADPAPVMNAMLLAPQVSAASSVGTVVAVVDAVLGPDTLARLEEARLQVAVADRIVVTKTDMLGQGGETARPGLPGWSRPATSDRDLETMIRDLNPAAPIILAADAVRLGPELFSDLPMPGNVPVRIAGQGALSPRPSDAGHRHAHGGGSVSTCTLRAKAVERASFQAFLDVLLRRLGPRLLRLKGLVGFAHDPTRPAVVHVVQHLVHPVRFLPAWPDGDHETRLVAILSEASADEVGELWAGFFGPPGVDRADAQALTRQHEPSGGLFA